MIVPRRYSATAGAIAFGFYASRVISLLKPMSLNGAVVKRCWGVGITHRGAPLDRVVETGEMIRASAHCCKCP